jgi:prophage maintenance system killer protein
LEKRPLPKKIKYLTVQDILWINLQVTKKVNSFHYATLEEATFYQFAYGDSDELGAQAARFLRGFVDKQPLSQGNEATAFVGFAAFLMLNDWELTVGDDKAADWFKSKSDPTESVRPLEHPHSHSNSVRDVVTQVFKAYPSTVASLSGHRVAVVADGAIH